VRFLLSDGLLQGIRLGQVAGLTVTSIIQRYGDFSSVASYPIGVENPDCQISVGWSEIGLVADYYEVYDGEWPETCQEVHKSGEVPSSLSVSSVWIYSAEWFNARQSDQ
jgi:hypothetical protein